MKLVLIESPLAANPGRSMEDHQKYAKACCTDALMRGEAPYASHLLYAQPGILNDLIPEQRELGIKAGLAWGAKAELTVVYTDCGISRGMEFGIAKAKEEGREVEYRTLPPEVLEAVWSNKL